jgi:hypothetical protein
MNDTLETCHAHCIILYIYVIILIVIIISLTDLRQFSGFRRVLWFPTPKNWPPQYNWCFYYKAAEHDSYIEILGKVLTFITNSNMYFEKQCIFYIICFAYSSRAPGFTTGFLVDLFCFYFFVFVLYDMYPMLPEVSLYCPLSCLGSLIYCSQTPLSYFAFQYFDIECTWGRLFWFTSLSNKT